ncbi:M23 family metallopeptidase [Deinococcus sp.]|uniref:M23 family metallopeptidase n=1 Tax=Deinococcus sp. TaxID=47478 RepID=UPI003CC6484E
MRPTFLLSLVLLPACVTLAHQAPALSDAQIAAPSRQFGLPFAGEPGPSTWLLGQGYGNTLGAYRQRSSTYGNIQGIHFGLDFSAPCGTPVRAIGDGTVSEVDGLHGSPPHNLVIRHAGGLSSLYGHLLERASVRVGQTVGRGQVVGRSGDSQGTCISAPHLHLEIRDWGHVRLFNPIGYIAADWDTLTLAGGFARGYEQDLNNPRRWQTPGDQPQARRGGPLLNEYRNPWPPAPAGAR